MLCLFKDTLTFCILKIFNYSSIRQGVGAGDMAKNKSARAPALMELTVERWGQIVNNKA